MPSVWKTLGWTALLLKSCLFWKRVETPVIANIWGKSIDEYAIWHTSWMALAA